MSPPREEVFKCLTSSPFTLELRQTKLSKSAIININANQSREYMDAYLFVRQLASQYKHPIILNYKSQLNAIRYCLDLTDSKFRKTLNNAVRLRLATIEGNHLRLLSNNENQQFKTVKKYDYHKTSNPKLFMQMVLLSNHFYKQKARTHKANDQTYLGLRISDRTNNGYSSEIVNYSITASCKAISDLFKLNSTTNANTLLKSLDKRGLIVLTDSTEQITPQQFKLDLSLGRKNIRYDKVNKTWYRINARTFKLNYNFRTSRIATPFDKLDKQAKATYLEMGYSVDQINRLLV